MLLRRPTILRRILCFIPSQVLYEVRQNLQLTRLTPQTRRLAHPCPPISQHRPLRQHNPPRLAQRIHIPPRIILLLPLPRPPRLQPRHRPHPRPRHHRSCLLRHTARARHEPALFTLSRKGPARQDRAGMYGQ